MQARAPTMESATTLESTRNERVLCLLFGLREARFHRRAFDRLTEHIERVFYTLTRSARFTADLPIRFAMWSVTSCVSRYSTDELT